MWKRESYSKNIAWFFLTLSRHTFDYGCCNDLWWVWGQVVNFYPWFSMIRQWMGNWSKANWNPLFSNNSELKNSRQSFMTSLSHYLVFLSREQGSFCLLYSARIIGVFYCSQSPLFLLIDLGNRLVPEVSMMEKNY